MSKISQTASLSSPSHLPSSSSSSSSGSSISEWDVKASTPSSSLRVKNQDAKAKGDVLRLQKIRILKDKKKRGESVGNDELEEFDDDLRDWINRQDSDEDESARADATADSTDTQRRLGSSNDGSAVAEETIQSQDNAKEDPPLHKRRPTSMIM